MSDEYERIGELLHAVYAEAIGCELDWSRCDRRAAFLHDAEVVVGAITAGDTHAGVWSDVVSALGGSRDRGFTVKSNPRTGQYEAWNWHWDDGVGDIFPVVADTPTDALRALAALIRADEAPH